MPPPKFTRWSALEPPQPAHPVARRIAATALVSASLALGRLASCLAAPVGGRREGSPQLEFHAEAGAPEGALYCDGKLVGWISGVTRL